MTVSIFQVEKYNIMVIIDLTIFSIQKVGGISVVWSEYLKRLKSCSEDINYLLINPDNNNVIADKLDLSGYNVRNVKSRGVISKYLPFLMVGNKKDVLHTSYYQWYPFYLGTKIVTLHDFMHEKFAPLKSKILHNVLKFLSLNSADIIICISEATMQDLKEIYPRIYKKKDVRVIENAASDDFYPDEGSTIISNQFLWVAGRSGYKNFSYAIKILGYLKLQGRIYNLSVVGPELTDKEISFANKVGVLGQIKVCENVSMDELRNMYSCALAFLYLSKYEGFGLPIIEAQKCLCPVVALKNPASLEVGGNSILYLVDDEEQKMLKIIEVIENGASRAKLVKKGLENSRRYDWDESVKKLVNVYMDYQR